jgi:hypothetical protein
MIGVAHRVMKAVYYAGTINSMVVLSISRETAVA